MRRTLAAVVALILLSAPAVGVASAAHEEPDRTVIGFELGPRGSATVHHTTAFDLSNDEERATYRRYADNESRRAAFRDEVVAELHERVGRPEAGEAFRRWRGAEVTRDGYRTDYTDRLGEVEVPTLFVHGEADDLFPVEWARGGQ